MQAIQANTLAPAPAAGAYTAPLQTRNNGYTTAAPQVHGSVQHRGRSDGLAGFARPQLVHAPPQLQFVHQPQYAQPQYMQPQYVQPPPPQQQQMTTTTTTMTTKTAPAPAHAVPYDPRTSPYICYGSAAQPSMYNKENLAWNLPVPPPTTFLQVRACVGEILKPARLGRHVDATAPAAVLRRQDGACVPPPLRAAPHPPIHIAPPSPFCESLAVGSW